MIVIEDKIISDDIKDKMFVCNIKKCKGACCVAGEGGAPLSDEEAELLPEIYEQIKPYLTEEGIARIEETGFSVQEEDVNYLSTPLRKSDNACVYVNFDENNSAYCGIERAYLDEKISFHKPVSCHLYPIRIKEHDDFHAINYDKWEICDDACSLGEELGVPLYKFLKAPLIRKYGEDFYDLLEATIAHIELQEED